MRIATEKQTDDADIPPPTPSQTKKPTYPQLATKILGWDNAPVNLTPVEYIHRMRMESTVTHETGESTIEKIDIEEIGLKSSRDATVDINSN